MVAADSNSQSPIDIDAQDITTTNLVLRKPVMDDAMALAELANDRTVAEMTGRIPHPYTLEDAVDFLTHTEADRGNSLRHAITAKSSGEFMGMVGMDRVEGNLVLGYWLGRQYRRRGFMSEAASALVAHVFDNTEVDTIISSARIINDGSKAILLRLGFAETGVGLIRSTALKGSVPVTHFKLEKANFRPKT